jgi:DNA-binding transcriptional MerR regulator
MRLKDTIASDTVTVYNLGVQGETALSIEELAARAGVSVRTVRYYIGEGLLSGPANRGKYASYDEQHLARLRLIRRLVDQHVPLAEVRERLAQLSVDEVHSVLQQEERQDVAAASPREYVSGLLARARVAPKMAAPAPVQAVAPPAPRLPAEAEPEVVQRYELAPGVELFVRADATRTYARLIERLLESARDVLGRSR